MVLASIHFLLFGLVAAIGGGAIAARFRGRRAGWLVGIGTFLAFVVLFVTLRQLVLLPLSALE
jgi:hypothetical protein